ncbi:MAG: hypothetical protein ACR2JA_09110 [Hydrogenophaga sp.]|uniref:hypothetical protein n=1 Tax=Hydrogenophaga sp. TaxID=1904254 RepID=UPI003D9AF52C
MSGQVYRKTEAGRAEVSQRRAGLSPATRQLLILVNGSDSVQVLKDRGLVDVRTALDSLLAQGLIEPLHVPPPRPVPAAAPAPEPAPPEDPQQLLALQRRAYQALQPHFGPDTPTVAQALLAARCRADFDASLGGIEAKLAIYMGRKQAAREVQALRSVPENGNTAPTMTRPPRRSPT